jgi:hypothetical protein
MIIIVPWKQDRGTLPSRDLWTKEMIWQKLEQDWGNCGRDVDTVMPTPEPPITSLSQSNVEFLKF